MWKTIPAVRKNILAWLRISILDYREQQQLVVSTRFRFKTVALPLRKAQPPQR